MWPLIRGLLSGIVGYVAGTAATVAVRGGSPSDDVSVTFGFVLGLIGWLFGIGLWNTWGREWLGREAKDERVSDWRRYFRFTPDHKVIGVQYLVTMLTVLLLGGLAAMFMRYELARPGQDLFDADNYNKLMSMHGILMIAVAVAGVLGAFGNYFVPLMIGARDMAFPRINALSYWLVPPVAIGLLSAPLLGSFDTGWTAYPPLSVVNEGGQVLFILAVITFGLSSILGGLNVVTTVTTMRAPGLSWGRLPIFCWAALAASVLSLLVTQFFAASLILVLLDRTAGTTFFDAAGGGDPLLYQHLFWFYSHPAVYIMVLPAFGVVLEIITHFSRKPLFAYKAVVAAMWAIVGLSIVVWAHHMFTSGMSDHLHAPFMALTEVISVPTGVIFLGAAGTIWQGRLRLKTPMLLSLGWMITFAIGGITGIFLADVVTDINLHDTYFVVAHFHYTIVGGTIFSLLSGSFYWFPKITGRMYHERAGQIFAVWLVFAFNLVFVPLFWLGVQGLNRRVADYPAYYAGVNGFASAAAYLLGASFLLYAGNMIWSARHGRPAPGNPWGATTLEWQVASPPPEHNFVVDPTIVGDPYHYGTPGGRHVEWAQATGGEE